ncbi:MAG: hypothetical protein KKG60_00810 [Nanoarchaeota archaeon]|nr:hypothetical protein [Nanoarchaeota archaeon]
MGINKKEISQLRESLERLYFFILPIDPSIYINDPLYTFDDSIVWVGLGSRILEEKYSCLFSEGEYSFTTFKKKGEEYWIEQCLRIGSPIADPKVLELGTGIKKESFEFKILESENNYYDKDFSIELSRKMMKSVIGGSNYKEVFWKEGGDGDLFFPYLVHMFSSRMLGGLGDCYRHSLVGVNQKIKRIQDMDIIDIHVKFYETLKRDGLSSCLTKG